jgi:RimJ/RimL family protein N-acetyltransferase
MVQLPDRLSAGDLELRRARVDMCDELLYAATASYPELRPWMTWAAQPLTREGILFYLEGAESRFEDGRDRVYVLVETDTGEVVGTSALHSKGDPRCLEIGYWVRTDRTKRGYASSAANALTEAAFHYAGVDRVKIRMDKANVASASVPPKIGFTLLGEESRPLQATGHSGTGLIWVRERPGDRGGP